MEGAAAAERRVHIDMHLHTARSFDCLSSPAAVLSVARARGMDRICVTDHNEIAAAQALKARFPAHVIVGEEVKTAEGVDVIGLFLTEIIPARTPALETCRRIHDQGGIVYVPHPFVGGKGGGGRVLQQIAEHVDALEGFNARVHDPALNARAVSWGNTHGVPLGAGSDAHTLREIARGHVEMPDFDDEPAAFLAALARGTLHGRTSSRLVHLASTFAKIRKTLSGTGRGGA